MKRMKKIYKQRILQSIIQSQLNVIGYFMSCKTKLCTEYATKRLHKFLQAIPSFCL